MLVGLGRAPVGDGQAMVVRWGESFVALTEPVPLPFVGGGSRGWGGP